jgi:uncharacterized protein (TIGR03437 family)
MKMRLTFLAASAAALLSLTGVAQAQTVESIPFRAILRPENEVPAVNLNASGMATVWLHVMRDADGRVVSGSADFIVDYNFPGPVTVTGLHIHRGAAGTNGPVTIDSTLMATQDPSGSAGVMRQGQIRPDNAAALATANDMLTDPSGFYVNLHTTQFPGGAIRGQLMRARQRVFMSLMNPRNEVPAITTLDASGTIAMTMLYTQQPDGTLTSASINFNLNYMGFPEGTRFTGFHIHRGSAAVNGPVLVDSGVQGGDRALPVGAGGAGNLNFTAEVNFGRGDAVNLIYDMLVNPQANAYVNLHTMVNPGGAIRGQLRDTDHMSFQQTLLPDNEVPAVTLAARGGSRVDLWTLRDEQSRVQAGSVVFDVNHRFPGEVTFVGLHIHNGLAGANGPVTVDSGVRTPGIASPSGFGNIYRQATISSAAGLATLNTLTTDPAAGYVNLHTTANPGGAVRDQVGVTVTAMPNVETVIAAVSDPTQSVTAPNGLISIYGSNLTRVATTSRGSETTSAPGTLNGTQVILGNRAAAVLAVSPRVISAQVPAEAPAGSQPLYVISPNGTSNTVPVTVGANAPSVFFDRIVAEGNAAIALKSANFSFVTPQNPAAAGENVWLILTGMGQTIPALATGEAAAGNTNRTVTPTVRIGGQSAAVSQSYAWPGMVGMYLLEVTVPAGAGSGWRMVSVSVGTAASNPTVVALR